MRILILFASTGGGHREASKAIESYILSKEKDAEVKSVDGLSYISPILDKVISGSYVVMARHLKQVYKYLYKVSDKPGVITDIVNKFIMKFSSLLMPLIDDYKPDIIISTHPFLSGMISTLKGEGKINSIDVTIITDYEVHNTWIHKNIDMYSVGSEDMVEQMVTRGIPRDKVYPFGIPVNYKFYENNSKGVDELREKLDLDPDKKVVLIMAGSFGVSNICEIYKELLDIDEDFQIVILTGNNQHLYQRMLHMTVGVKKKTRLIKFTHEVYKYMRMADVLITKPGGLTVSEALASNIPLIVFDSIPGQEEANAKFLINNGMAVTIGKGRNCTDVISKLLSEDTNLNTLKTNCERFNKDDSVKNILNTAHLMIENEERKTATD